MAPGVYARRGQDVIRLNRRHRRFNGIGRCGNAVYETQIARALRAIVLAADRDAIAQCRFRVDVPGDGEQPENAP